MPPMGDDFSFEETLSKVWKIDFKTKSTQLNQWINGEQQELLITLWFVNCELALLTLLIFYYLSVYKSFRFNFFRSHINSTFFW